MNKRLIALAALLVLALAPAVLEARPPKGEGVTCVCSNGEYIHADRCGDCDILCTPGFPIRCKKGPRPFPIPKNSEGPDGESAAGSCAVTSVAPAETPEGSSNPQK